MVTDAMLLSLNGGRRVKRRRRLRLAVLFITLMGVCCTVYYRVDWVSILPSRLLVLIEAGWADDRVGAELLRRYDGGKLSASDARRFLDAHLSLHLRIRTPRPRELPVVVEGLVVCGAGDAGYCVRGDRWRVTIDGREAADGTSSDRQWQGIVQWYALPELAAGRHAVTVEQGVSVLADSPRGYNPLPYLPYSTVLTATAEIVIEDRPLQDYQTALWSEELAAEVRDSLRLHIGQSEDLGTLWYVQAKLAHTRLAAEVWIRTGAGCAARLVDHSFVTGEDLETEWLLTDEEGFLRSEKVSHFDLYLLPSPLVAFECRCDTYFGGVVRWSNVPTENAELGWQDLAPTDVQRWMGELEPPACTPDAASSGL